MQTASPDRGAVRIAGALFLAAFGAYGTGAFLVDSVLSRAQPMAMLVSGDLRLPIGAVLMLVNSAIVAAIGVLLLPALRRVSPLTAHGYLATRLFEAILLAFGAVALLALLPLSRATGGTDAPAMLQALQGMAYQVAMAGLGFGSLFLCAALYRARLVPPPLALAGLAGYGIFLIGALTEMFGLGWGVILSIPGGLFELAFGIWLIARGFRPPNPV